MRCWAFVPLLLPLMFPEWLRYLSRQPAKTYADDVNMVILLDDNVTTVKENGDIVQHGRRAVKILRPEGRTRARSFQYPITAIRR